MSTLIFSLPLANASASTDYQQTVLSTAAAGPRDKEVWALLPAAALSWHQVSLPAGLQRNPARLTAALHGLLEEQLLEEPEQMHFALQPGWQAGALVWVAVCRKDWLQGHLQQLQSQQHAVHRIVPEITPGCSPAQAWVTGTREDAWLWLSSPDLIWGLPLQAGLAMLVQTQDSMLIQADPRVAESAERCLQGLQNNAPELAGWRVLVAPALQRATASAQTGWDLAQFDLAAHGHARWLQSFKRRWNSLRHGSVWRPLRWGLLLLLAVTVVGLNLSSWQMQRQTQAQHQAQRDILTQTFPHVTVVVDAPLQMTRELERLRRSKGATSGSDLEPLLNTVWPLLPPGQSISALDFQSGELRLQGLQLSGEQAATLSQALRSKGYGARQSGAQWLISPKEAP